MISWKEYLSSVIEQYREGVERIVKEEIARKRFTEETIKKQLQSFQLNTTFFSPCQIEVIEIEKTKIFNLFVTFDKDRPDKEILVTKIPKDTDIKRFIDEHSKRFPYWSKQLSDTDLRMFERHKTTLRKDVLLKQITKQRKPLGTTWMYIDSRSSLYSRAFDFRKQGIARFVKETLEHFNREFARILEGLQKISSVERIPADLRAKVGQIKQENIRSDLMKLTDSIEKLIHSYSNRLKDQERLTTAIREDVDGVRQLVGVSTEYQDWKLLVSDVHRLKGEHVPKEIFDAKVGELGTRIDSLSEIREAYDKILAQQTEFMKQQAEVMRQQSSFIKWIKYATILLPIAVISVPIIEIISVLIRHYLNIP